MEFWETIWKSVVLGTVQGLTEFLPVSSSGHLVLLQRTLGFDPEAGSMTFVNVMLHLGTLFAVIFAFRKEIAALFHRPFTRLWMLAATAVPAGIVGLLFHDGIDSLFAGEHGVLLLAPCFAFTALLLILTQRAAKRKRRPFGWRTAIPMSVMQAVALFPGVSRSGSTIAAGTLAGADAGECAKFSFLMSIPVILGSAAVELTGAFGPSVHLGGGLWLGVLLGAAAAAVSGMFAIKVVMKLVGKADYKWFAVYLFLLALACLWLDLVHILPAGA